MKHVYAAGACLVIVLAAALILGPFRNEAPELAQPSMQAQAQSQADATRWQASFEQSRTSLDRERIRQLEAMAKRSAQMEVATRAMLHARQQAQAQARPAWNGVLTTNQAAYEILLDQARKSPKGQVPCTLCDGFSYMPCVLCSQHDGKCTECRGLVYALRDVLCPSCLGSGKCYLCTGSGKMFCPFCDDGMILSQPRPPAADPPLQ